MVAGDGSTAMFARELPQVIAFLGTIFWVVSFTFGVILMINQRQILSVRESADARLQAEESLRLAERQLALVREQRQRKDFVHDLHDGVGAATVNVAHLVDLLKSRGVADWLHDLRTHAEETLGARGIAVVWRVAGVPPVASIDQASAALSFGRAVREAIANVAKHAQATRAVVSIRFHPGAVAVRVRDDGVGFPVSPPAAGRHGLAGMERRVRSLGGRLRLGRPSGAGSCGARVSIVVPLPLSLVGSDSGAASSMPPADRRGR
jgi:signal transduction histidine kinase